MRSRKGGRFLPSISAVTSKETVILTDRWRMPSFPGFAALTRLDGTSLLARLSELFTLPGKSLVVDSFMYAEGANPCPMCTSFVDSLNDVARHVRGQINLAVAAKGPLT